MELIRSHILHLQIENESDVGVCRRKSVSIAQKAGFDNVKTGEIAIAVTEMVTNVIKHGGSKGKLFICQLENENQQKGIEVWCCDMGNRIPNPEESVTDGYTINKSLGLGLGTIRRFSDEFEINPLQISDLNDSCLTEINKFNNCVRMVKWVPSKIWLRKNHDLLIGAASRCKPGETLNGDTYVISHISKQKTVVAIIDGLGHGKEAHFASQMAKKQFELKQKLPLKLLLEHIHKAIRGTRGVVAALASIDSGTNKLAYSGIGNIEGFLFSLNEKKGLVSFGGIIGHNMPVPKIFEFNFNSGDYLCLFSDGIKSGWNFKNLDRTEHPQKNAEYLLNNFSNQNDDATVLIIRNNT